MVKLKFPALALIIVLVFSLACGCSSSHVKEDTVFDFYNKVQMEQKKEDVDTALGVNGKESTMLDNCYDYINQDTGYGVSILYGDENQVTSKTLLYNSDEELASLCNKKVTQKQADSITEKMTYEEIKDLLGGDGIQINSTQIPFDDNKASFIYIWVNKDGSKLQVVFGTDGTNSTIFFD